MKKKITLLVMIFAFTSMVLPYEVEYNTQKNVPDIVQNKQSGTNQSNIIKHINTPKQQIVAKKQKVIKKASRSSVNKKFKVRATAYTAGYESTGKTKENPTYGITASQKKVKEGVTIAADWNIFPNGTKLYIKELENIHDGDGIYIVQDKGGLIDNYDIDIYMDDLTLAREFGVKMLEVEVLEWGKK